MPELPEVEVSRRGVAPYLEGQNIVAVRVHQPRLRWPVPEAIQRVTGVTIDAVRRRAKYLIIETRRGSLIIHLGMSGALRVLPAESERLKHDHVELVMESGLALRLNDPRRFGAVLWQEPGEQASVLTRLGPEPLGDSFDGERLYRLSRGRRSAVKNFIMDNAVVVGVGNIYATESLFHAGIDPRRAAGRVSPARYEALATAIKQVLARAIEQGGTTLKDFTRADGKPGYFKQELLVYGRSGELCVQCQSIIEKVQLGQRTSAYCPTCQR